MLGGAGKLKESCCFGISLGSWRFLRHGVNLPWAKYDNDGEMSVVVSCPS